jgi:hypothetical protein
MVLALSIAMSSASAGLAAATGRGVPAGLIHHASTIDQVAVIEMPPVDIAALREEDDRRELSGRPTAPRFAAAIDVGLTPDSSGTWTAGPDGTEIWRLRIASPGASSLNLHFDRFDLPAGTKVWLYDRNGSMVQGPFTRNHRNVVGELWTPVVLGDEVVVELDLPAGARASADLRIARVNHGYRFFGERESGAEPKQGSCNIDVICPDGDPWRDQIRSAARITILGAFLCSGQLVNNTAEDETPYFLTAQHCVENASEAPSVVAFWNYEAPVCGTLTGGSLSQNQSGSTLVASWQIETGSDFTLVRLDQSPDPSFNVYFAGWDVSGAIPSSSTGIHHPQGDEKAISFDDDPLTKENHYGFGSHQWRVGQWERGTTEGGSSGSCIFDRSTKLCVGTLTAGIASCTNQAGWDIYGRMDAHWTGDGTPEGRLSDWLDPIGSGAVTLPGRNAGGTVTTETWLVPAAASAPGVGDSNWKSQLAVSNPTAETRNARVFYVEGGEDWPGSLLSGPHSIPAGGSLFLDDPLIGLRPTSGLLYVTVDGEGLPVTTRTYNLAADNGTFGQGIPGILLDDTETTATELILPMVHSVPGRFRTNLGVVQTSSGSFAVRVEIHAPDGTVLAAKSFGFADAYNQINDVFDNMGIGDTSVEGAWVSVTLLGGSPAYWTAFASVVDNTTDDPTYIIPVAR